MDGSIVLGSSQRKRLLAVYRKESVHPQVRLLDGREVEVQPVENLGALTIGPAEIGNWAHKNDRLNARAFGGRVEELVIYSDALTAPEIEALYASGAP